MYPRGTAFPAPKTHLSPEKFSTFDSIDIDHIVALVLCIINQKLQITRLLSFSAVKVVVLVSLGGGWRLDAFEGLHQLSYANVKADECATIVGDRGERTVRYKDGVFTVIGYYLAWNHGNERVLYYVLRAPSRVAQTEAVS